MSTQGGDDRPHQVVGSMTASWVRFLSWCGSVWSACAGVLHSFMGVRGDRRMLLLRFSADRERINGPTHVSAGQGDLSP